MVTSGYLEMTVSSVKDDFQMLKFWGSQNIFVTFGKWDFLFVFQKVEVKTDLQRCNRKKSFGDFHSELKSWNT